MHALLEALALRPGCTDNGDDTVTAPQCRISDVFTEVSAISIASGVITIVDENDDSTSFTLTTSGEAVTVEEVV